MPLLKTNTLQSFIYILLNKSKARVPTAVIIPKVFFAREKRLGEPEIFEIRILLTVLTRLASTAVLAAVSYEILPLTASKVTETITPELLIRAPRAVK